MLINKYSDGNQYISPHHDNDEGLNGGGFQILATYSENLKNMPRIFEYKYMGGETIKIPHYHGYSISVNGIANTRGTH